MLPHENPDLVAKRGKNFCGNSPSHSVIRCSSCRAALQHLFTLRTAELVRGHGPDEAVACGAGMMRLDLLAALSQRGA